MNMSVSIECKKIYCFQYVYYKHFLWLTRGIEKKYFSKYTEVTNLGVLYFLLYLYYKK